MSMKLYRSKRLWLDLEIDWSNWLMGVTVDRFHSYYNDRMSTDIALFVGPFAIDIIL